MGGIIMATDDKEFTRHNVVILAETYKANGKYDASWIQLIKDGNVIGRPSAYELKVKLRPMPGCIYIAQVIVIDDHISSMRFGTLEFSDFDLLPNQFLRDIHTDQRNNSQAANAVRQSIKNRTDDGDHELSILQGLRIKYQSTNALGKLAMEVRLLNYLRNGRDL